MQSLQSTYEKVSDVRRENFHIDSVPTEKSYVSLNSFWCMSVQRD